MRTHNTGFYGEIRKRESLIYHHILSLFVQLLTVPTLSASLNHILKINLTSRIALLVHSSVTLLLYNNKSVIST